MNQPPKSQPNLNMISIQRHIVLFVLLSTFALAGVWSCRKDVNEFRPYPPTFTDLNPLLVQVPEPATTTVFILSGLVSDTVLTTPDGIQVFLTDTEHLFADADGTLVPSSSCQKLTLEVVEVLKKGDMVARGIPGVSTDDQLIESGGMVRINVFCDGTALQLFPGRNLKIHLPNADQFSDLSIFNGIVQNDTLRSWENTAQAVYLADWISPSTGETILGYEIIASRIGWVNCGRFLNEPTSTLCVQLPDGFSELNTQAFIVFKNILVVAPLTPNGNGQYCFANAPKGYPVKLVTVSELGDLYWLGNAETEIGTNATLSLAPQQTGELQVLNFLKGL